MREDSRRRTSCTGAPRSPRASLHVTTGAVRASTDAMREDSRRRTSCTGAPRTPRASLRVPTGAVRASAGAMREVSRRRASGTAARRRARAAMREISRRRTSCTGAPCTPSASLRVPIAAIGRHRRLLLTPSAFVGSRCGALSSARPTRREAGRALASRTAPPRSASAPTPDAAGRTERAWELGGLCRSTGTAGRQDARGASFDQES